MVRKVCLDHVRVQTNPDIPEELSSIDECIGGKKKKKTCLRIRSMRAVGYRDAIMNCYRAFSTCTAPEHAYAARAMPLELL